MWMLEALTWCAVYPNALTIVFDGSTQYGSVALNLRATLYLRS